LWPLFPKCSEKHGYSLMQMYDNHVLPCHVSKVLYGNTFCFAGEKVSLAHL